MFDIEGFREAEAFESGAESLGAHAAAFHIFWPQTLYRRQ
jgi:hypothetical protein